MKSIAYALGALLVAATAAHAEGVTRNTITGYAASVAVARGIPTDGSVTLENHKAPQFRQSAIQTTSDSRSIRVR